MFNSGGEASARLVQETQSLKLRFGFSSLILKLNQSFGLLHAD